MWHCLACCFICLLFHARVVFCCASLLPSLLSPSCSLTRALPPFLPLLSALVFNSRYVAELKDISFLDEAAVCASEADQTRSSESFVPHSGHFGATTRAEKERPGPKESDVEETSAAPVVQMSAVAASAAAALGAQWASAPALESEGIESQRDEDDESAEFFDGTTLAAQREAHADRFPHEGFTSLVIARLAGPLAGQVRLKETVHSVSVSDESGEQRVVLRTHSGHTFSARHAIVALPLGVLKGLHVETRVTFDPPLAAPKRAAIRSLGFGTENKVSFIYTYRYIACESSSQVDALPQTSLRGGQVILQFELEDVFWDTNEHYLQCTDDYVRFVNLHCFDQPGVIVAFVSPPYSHRMMDNEDDRGCRTAGYVLSVLYKMCVTFVRLSKYSPWLRRRFVFSLSLHCMRILLTI